MKTLYKYNKVKHLLSMLILMVLGSAFSAKAQVNTLSVQSVEAPAGKSLVLPIELSNTSEVTAVQFDVQLPYALDKITDEESGTEQFAVMPVKSRLSNHSVSVVETYSYYHRYRIMVMSNNNSLLQGTKGAIVNLQLTLAEELTNGTKLNVYLSSVKISDVKGKPVENIQSKNGVIEVQTVPRPDLQPLTPTLKETYVSPGDEVTFRWTVKNHGDDATKTGWTEKLYLENAAGTRVYVGMATYDETIAAGSSVSREATVTLSELPGIGGLVRPVVVVVPAAGCGESNTTQSDNTVSGKEYTMTVRKVLKLVTYSKEIPENSTGSYLCELHRSGDTKSEQSFPIEITEPDRLTIEGSNMVKFYSGSNKVSFYVKTIDNDVVNLDNVINIVANKDGLYGDYPETNGIIKIEENDKYGIEVSFDKVEYNEGNTIHATISVPERWDNEPLTLNLSIQQAKRFKLPQTITLKSGQTKYYLDIPVLQDNKPANDETIELTVSADRYETAKKHFVLHDDDVPAIDFSMTPTVVNEGDGPTAMYCTLTRSVVTDSKVTVKISDDSDGELTYGNGSRWGRTFTMEPGTTTINFYMGPENNSLVDGTRTVKVTAAVYVTDCNCTAIGNLQSSVTIPVTILDNDGPTLTVTSQSSTILEGSEYPTTITVERNDGFDHDMTVTLSSQGDELTFGTKQLVIPAGKKSADTTILVASNGKEGDDRVVMLYADAEGFTQGTTWIFITDQTLADYNVKSITPASKSVVSGEGTVLTVCVSNQGAVSNGKTIPYVIRQGGQVAYSGQFPAIAPGSTAEQRIALSLPTVPSTYRYEFEINQDRKIKEIVYQNNLLSTDIDVVSAYEFTANVDKTILNEGGSVTLSGIARHKGEPMVDLVLEPYIIYNGQRTALSAKTGDDGTWAVAYPIPDGLRGDFSYGVCDPGAEDTAASGTFTVYGFSRASSDYLKHSDLYINEPYASSFSIRNLSASAALHNIRLESVTDDANGSYKVSMVPVSTLAVGGSADISYTITGTAETSKNEWQHVMLHLISDEGAKLDVTLYCYTANREPNLVLSTTSINTTVNKETPRTYPIILTNTGLGETGKISIALPKGLSDLISLASPSELSSLATGDSATVVLRLNGKGYDVNIIQKGSIAINCENGSSKLLYFNVKVVNEEKGTLKIRVSDETTYYGNKEGEHPYLAGAKVTVLDYNTGVELYSAVTDEDGYAVMENVNEGYYQFNVSAEKHNSYRNTIYINPGETTEKDVTINYKAITINWNVEETTVEDEYNITSSLTYETTVPVPVCLITAPDTIPIYDLEEGQSLMYNVVTRNVGLITATDCQISVPEVAGFTFVPLKQHEGFSLPAESSYIIPVLVTRNVSNPETQPARRRSPEALACRLVNGMRYLWPCGKGSTDHGSGSNSHNSSTGKSCDSPSGPGPTGKPTPLPDSPPGHADLDPTYDPDGDPNKPITGDKDLCAFAKLYDTRIDSSFILSDGSKQRFGW